MSYTPGVGGDPAQLAQRISSNIQKITQCYSIEANVENAEVHVQQANQQLSRAADYQRKSRKTLCIIILILVIGVAIISLIIWGLNH
uniref:cDNA FLJ50258, weakly similar to Syntaxin-7 n=1 Tax=Homo sapiens TaxID=9606 RepID=B4DWC2_HUMAN|nr:unnamed protein product [Homo sapiens]